MVAPFRNYPKLMFRQIAEQNQNAWYQKTFSVCKQMHTRVGIAFLLFLLISQCLSQRIPSFIIDDYTVDAPTMIIIEVGAASSSQQSPLILGGKRDIEINVTAAGDMRISTMEVLGGNLVGAVPPQTEARFTVRYDGVNGGIPIYIPFAIVDLTSLGDSFLIYILTDTPTEVQFTLIDVMSNLVVYSFIAEATSSEYTILFSDFSSLYTTFDFSAVASIEYILLGDSFVDFFVDYFYIGKLPPTSTATATPTRSRTPSITPTRSRTPTRTPTRSRTPSVTPTRSRTPSVTPTISNTRSRTPSVTPTRSRTPTRSVTPTRSRTPSVTPTIS